MGHVCVNALGVLQASLPSLCCVPQSVCQTRWKILVSMCVTLPVVLLVCAWLAQVPAVLWGSLPDPAQARQPIYYPLCTDADCRAARAHLCQGHPVSQGRVRATAQQDSAFFQAVNFLIPRLMHFHCFPFLSRFPHCPGSFLCGARSVVSPSAQRMSSGSMHLKWSHLRGILHLGSCTSIDL